MDKMNLMKSFLAAAVAGGIALSANAQVIFSDDFQGYANTAEMNAVWTNNFGTTSLGADPSNSANNVLTVGANGGRVAYTFDAITPTNENPIWFQFDFYDYNDGVEQQWAMISNGMFGNIVAIGLQNHVNAGVEAFESDQYQLRVQGHGDWIQMETERSEGWVTFGVEIGADALTVYVNGVADPSSTGLTHNYTTFSSIALGPNLTGGDSLGHYDNVSLEIIPEPSTYAAIFGGLALVGAFVYRRRMNVKK